MSLCGRRRRGAAVCAHYPADLLLERDGTDRQRRIAPVGCRSVVRPAARRVCLLDGAARGRVPALRRNRDAVARPAGRRWALHEEALMKSAHRLVACALFAWAVAASAEPS